MRRIAFEIEKELEEPINFLKAPSTVEHKLMCLADVLEPAHRKADDLSSTTSTKKSNPGLAAAINRLKPFFELALDTLTTPAGANNYCGERRTDKWCQGNFFLKMKDENAYPTLVLINPPWSWPSG